jgi:predicted RNase H-like nuclease (RuvC/YqgF family)
MGVTLLGRLLIFSCFFNEERQHMANQGMSLEVKVEILMRENQEMKRNFAESERKNKEQIEKLERTIAEIERKREEDQEHIQKLERTIVESQRKTEEEGNTFGVFFFVLLFIFSSYLRFNESLFFKYR